MGWERWIRSQLNETVVMACLSIILVFVLLFIGMTIRDMKNFNANIASLFATMAGIGVGGLLTFFVLENRSRHRQHLSVKWYYHFIHQNAGLLSADVGYYLENGFKQLKFEEEYSFKKKYCRTLLLSRGE